MTVTDYEFGPKEVKVGVGDSVTWSFDMGSHTTTGDSGQPKSWDSGPATSPVGTKFTQTFDTPGRFSYYCIPHQSFMKARWWWAPTNSKSQTKFKQVPAEQGHVQLQAGRGREGRGLHQGAEQEEGHTQRLKPGRHSIALRGLKEGRYKGTVTFTDDFDKVSKVRVSVRVP